jgi:hypothetical protein
MPGPGPLHWDRATVVHPRSLQIFEAMGLVDKLLDVGCKQRVIKVYSAGKQLGAIDLSTSGSIYGFNLGVSEEVSESMAETELINDYSRSPIVTGDANSGLAAGFRLPDTIAVQGFDGPPRRLHQLAHRAGHTLMLMAGPTADASAHVELHIASRFTYATIIGVIIGWFKHECGSQSQVARYQPSH